jgi:hypothetical protein
MLLLRLMIKLYIKILKQERSYWKTEAIRNHIEMCRIANKFIPPIAEELALDAYAARAKAVSTRIGLCIKFLDELKKPI